MAIKTTDASNQRILALDLSITCTGWAASLPNSDTVTGTKSFIAPKNAVPAIRFSLFSNWLEVLLEKLAPSAVVIEAAACRQQGQAQDALIGLRVLTMSACAVRAIPVTDIYPTTLKRLATGAHDADKDAMKARAAELFSFYDPVLDVGGDEADALLLLHVFKNCRDELDAVKVRGKETKAKKRLSTAKKSRITKQTATALNPPKIATETAKKRIPICLCYKVEKHGHDEGCKVAQKEYKKRGKREKAMAA